MKTLNVEFTSSVASYLIVTRVIAERERIIVYSYGQTLFGQVGLGVRFCTFLRFLTVQYVT